MEGKIHDINQQLDNGYDIKCRSKAVVSEIASYVGPSVTDEEEQLYHENCVPDESGKSPRLRWCGEIGTIWQKAAKNRRERDQLYAK